MHNELQNLYSLPNTIRLRWVGHVPCIGHEYIQDLVGKPEEKRPLGNPK
jgi:hypothetical protein